MNFTPKTTIQQIESHRFREQADSSVFIWSINSNNNNYKILMHMYETLCFHPAVVSSKIKTPLRKDIWIFFAIIDQGHCKSNMWINEKAGTRGDWWGQSSYRSSLKAASHPHAAGWQPAFLPAGCLGHQSVNNPVCVVSVSLQTAMRETNQRLQGSIVGLRPEPWEEMGRVLILGSSPFSPLI